MFATDFLFDRHYARDFGLMICSFDQSPETASGGEIEYNTVKTPGRDRFSFYGAQRNTAIEWHFSICKNPDQNQTSYFTQYEESRIAKWLLQTDGYKLFHFCQEGYEDIFYHACINMTPHQFLGQTIGFDLTVTSDCACGFTGVITRKAVLNNKSPVLKFRVLSDVKACILPRIRIRGTGSFQISNEADSGHPAAVFHNLSAEETPELIMDSDADILFIQNKDAAVPLPNPDMFNWRFLRLVDGENRIVLGEIPKTESTESSLKTSDTDNIEIEIEIQYREPRRIIV